MPQSTFEKNKKKSMRNWVGKYSTEHFQHHQFSLRCLEVVFQGEIGLLDAETTENANPEPPQ